MSIAEERGSQIYPTLTRAQREEAQRFASGKPRRFAAGEVLFALGETPAPAFLVLEGRMDVLRRLPDGTEAPLSTHFPGQISGEISQLAGRPALAEGRAGPDGCLALPFDAAHLRALIVGSADIGEIVMRAFILRRTAMITEGGAGAVLIGRAGEPAMVRLQGFLTRNGFPFATLDTETDPDAADAVERFALHDADLPVLICPNGTLLKRPRDAEAGLCLGITPVLSEGETYDVAVVGAGPAGLATAVYAASEGLSTLVLDARAFGGQAGASARIENYLGFPTGITGQALTARAFTQAQKFGAEIAIPLEVAHIECGGDSRRPEDPIGVVLTDDRRIQARSVVIASGVRYRRPDIPNLRDFEGAGVSYWASPVEAKLCAGEEVALVGAGNSAGQAVVFLAARVKTLHLVVRGDGLEASMSRYLIDRIAALRNVQLHLRSEIVALDGEPGIALSGAQFRDRDTGETRRVALRHVFLFIGADANTGWLERCQAARDEKGFVLTGPGAAGSEGAASHNALWEKLGRAPMPLETSIPGVFAVGDVRAGSTKRVAAAVGDGAAVVAQLHALLAPPGEHAA